MTAQRVHKYDWIIWIFVLTLLAVLALSMLIRDSKKQYGALSFGDFPAFIATGPNGQPFDQHKMNGQLSAVIIAETKVSPEILMFLEKLSRMTAMGKKYLRTLIFTQADAEPSTHATKYLMLDEENFNKVLSWRNKVFKEGVILVDQNGVVRGVFNLDVKLERMNFEGAVRGIL